MLDPYTIFWDDKSGAYVSASGICYDPIPRVKAFYTLIDQDSGDLRPLDYIQLGGEFLLAMNGKIGKVIR